MPQHPATLFGATAASAGASLPNEVVVGGEVGSACVYDAAIWCAAHALPLQLLLVVAVVVVGGVGGGAALMMIMMAKS